MVEHAGFGKVALRSRGKYLSSEDGRMPMMCNRNVVLEWERFVYVEHPEGTCSHAATMVNTSPSKKEVYSRAPGARPKPTSSLLSHSVERVLTNPSTIVFLLFLTLNKSSSEGAITSE